MLDIFSLYFVVVVMVSPPPPLPRLEKLDEGEGSIGLLPCRSRQGFWTTLCQVFFRLELSCVLVQFLSVGWFIKGVGYSCSKKVRHCVGLWRRWVFLGPLYDDDSLKCFNGNRFRALFSYPLFRSIQVSKGSIWNSTHSLVICQNERETNAGMRKKVNVCAEIGL